MKAADEKQTIAPLADKADIVDAGETAKANFSPAPKQSMGLLLFIFVLAIFLGFELISKVPSQLHTPLMSGSNAISGITIVGALLAVGKGDSAVLIILGTLAVTFAMINVVGGYLVTDRMLGMFKHKE
jgi:NAD(P) transhydrogenase subunit alpha